MIDSDFDKLENCTERLYTSYLNLHLREKDLPKCKRRIFSIKMSLWRTQLERCLSGIIRNVGDKNKIDDVTKQCLDILLENNVVNENIAKFYFNFHKQFSCAYVKYINQKVLNNNDLTIMDKVEKLIEEFLELMNISLIELNSLKIDCCIFNENIDLCYGEKSCSQCNDVDNVVFLSVIPEYFLFKGVFDKLLDAFNMIKNPDKVILIVNYKYMCNRMEYYNWEERNAYERYLKCKPFFKKIYFYDYHRCVDFGKYRKEFEESDQLIENKQKLYRVIDDWRVENNKPRKYEHIYNRKVEDGCLAKINNIKK